MSKKRKCEAKGGCILFVDDEKPIRESLGELLTACGFKVLLADSHETALDVLEGDEEVEAILCDMKMPGESGLEVLRYLNDEKKNIPVIFLTGYGSLETSQEALRNGAFDYILKPIDDKDKVVLPLKHAVEKYRLEKQNKEMHVDILRIAEEHKKILEHILTDVDTKEKVEKRISRILDKWKE